MKQFLNWYRSIPIELRFIFIITLNFIVIIGAAVRGEWYAVFLFIVGMLFGMALFTFIEEFRR